MQNICVPKVEYLLSSSPQAGSGEPAFSPRFLWFGTSACFTEPLLVCEVSPESSAFRPFSFE